MRRGQNKMEDKRTRRLRRQKSIKTKIQKSGFRLSIFRSNRYLYAQLIDQESGKTIFGMLDKKSPVTTKAKGTKTERAKLFGQYFGKALQDKKIKKVIFDRGGNLYHGRIEAFVEGLKEGEVEF